MTRTMIERVRARPHKTTRDQAPGTLSAHGFQRWLGEWKELAALGWDVQVLLARDESHLVGLACLEEGGE